MEGSNPFFVALLYLARFLIPIVILLGISYLLRRLGIIAKPPITPSDDDENENDD